MADINLLTPGRIDGFDTKNRMIMAPMTRSRAHAGGVPSELAITYYAQRASAGLILTEGTAPSAVGLGYARTPAIHTQEQIAAWKKITDAVHAKGGRMYLQFMHVGRIAHSVNRYTDEPPVAPSVVKAAGQMWTDATGCRTSTRRARWSSSEIPGVIEEYAQATRNALAAGFDGVELHSASGYLPMQFLSTGTNKRTDAYGGSVNNRIRFVIEALEAMIAAAGSSGRVGMKISPAMPFNDIHDDNPVETYTTLVKADLAARPRLPARAAHAADPEHVRAAAAALQRAVCRRRRVRLRDGQRAAGFGQRRLRRVRQAVHVEPRPAGALRQRRGDHALERRDVLHARREGLHRLTPRCSTTLQ